MIATEAEQVEDLRWAASRPKSCFKGKVTDVTKPSKDLYMQVLTPKEKTELSHYLKHANNSLECVHALNQNSSSNRGTPRGAMHATCHQAPPPALATTSLRLSDCLLHQTSRPNSNHHVG